MEKQAMRKPGIAIHVWLAFTVLALLVCILSTRTVRAEEVTQGGSTSSDFTIIDGVLIEYNGAGGSVAVPDGVVSIGCKAFMNSGVTEVILPDTVQSIEYSAFQSCSLLWRIRFSGNLQSIGSRAFCGCTALQEVVCPASLQKIDSRAFSDCVSLRNVVLPDSLRTIRGMAFYDCPSLAVLRIPRSVTEIDNSAVNGSTVIECYKGTAAARAFQYRDRNLVHVLDAVDISALTVQLGQTEYVYTGERCGPEVIVKEGGTRLERFVDYDVTYEGDQKRGVCRVTVTMRPGAEGKYQGSKTLLFYVYPRSVRYLYSGLKTSSNQVELCWPKQEECTGYEVHRYDGRSKKWTLLKRISGTSFTDKKRKAGTSYRYKLRAYIDSEGQRLYAKKDVLLTVTTLPDKKTIRSSEKLRAAGAAPKISAVNTNVGQKLDTVDIGWGNWSHVSPVSEFQDEKGNYCFAYLKGKYIYIRKYNSRLKAVGTVKLKKKYPKFGTVLCGLGGNYFVVWGKTDEKIKGKVDTIAVSKYSPKGKHLATTKFYTDKDPQSNGGWGTQSPFDSGNCAAVVKGDLLICSYARHMYNGHQSNDVIAVNMKTMKADSSYDNYVSHSFNQKILVASGGDVIFVNHGDAFPRGLDVQASYEGGSVSNVPFHFYGSIGDNYTGAQLGGIAELSSGYLLAAAAPKSLGAGSLEQQRNVFVQLLSRSDLSSLLKAQSRTGEAGGLKVSDKGVKWLTSYSKSYKANAVSVTAISKDRAVVMWEKLKVDDNVFVDSYYTILAANGTVLQKTTSLGYRRLNLYEDPVYRNGAIYWTSSFGATNSVRTYKLVVDSLTTKKKVGKVTGLTCSYQSYWGASYATVSWLPLEDAQGYEVWYSSSKNGKYRRIEKSSGNVYTVLNLSGADAKKGYYKVRAWYKVKNKIKYGPFCAPVRAA